jgi:hypothetical protein
MDKKVFLMGLIYSCPLKRAYPNCPVEVFRKSSILDLVKKNHQLSDQEILAITKHHVKCRKKREALKTANSARL